MSQLQKNFYDCLNEAITHRESGNYKRWSFVILKNVIYCIPATHHIKSSKLIGTVRQSDITDGLKIEVWNELAAKAASLISTPPKQLYFGYEIDRKATLCRKP
jgi:hypothetical protein